MIFYYFSKDAASLKVTEGWWKLLGEGKKIRVLPEKNIEIVEQLIGLSGLQLTKFLSYRNFLCQLCISLYLNQVQENLNNTFI